MANQATLADVALLAGVSLSTASRALGQGHGRTVGPELRARVRAAAAELSYSPNAHAQAMRSASSAIGLIVHDILDPFAATIASGVLEAARERNLLVSIAATGTDPDVEVQLVESLRRQRASAVILVGSRFADSPAQRWLAEEISAIRASGGEVVVVGQNQLNVPAIVIDNAEGAEHLAKVLWSQGYRRFAVLAGPEDLLTSEERLAGFRQGLGLCGFELPDENVIGSTMTRHGGHSAMTELLDREIDVECVFAVNDVMAVGAMAALHDQRLRVPEDMAVAGFGDIAALRDIHPSLTTVRLPLAAIGRRALEMALSGPGADSASSSEARNRHFEIRRPRVPAASPESKGPTDDTVGDGGHPDSPQLDGNPQMAESTHPAGNPQMAGNRIAAKAEGQQVFMVQGEVVVRASTPGRIPTS